MSSWKKIAGVIGGVAVIGAGAAVAQGAFVAAVLVALGGLAAIAYTRSVLSPYGEVIDAVERLAQGDLTQPRLTLNLDGEVGRMATAVNQLLTQLRMLSEEATELANGYIGVRQLQSKVLETGQLSAVDLPASASQGDLNRSFAQLTNQLRRLTVKAYIIANDQLFNPALDEELPGELGDSFGMMVHNLRNLAGRARQIAGGDLTSQVEGDGDLTNVFNEMVTGLREVVEEIMRSALHVATSTEEMLQVLHQHEQSAQHQAAKIRQTQLTVEGLFNSSDAIADSARQVSRAAEDTCQKNRQIGAHIQELNQHSERISEILKLIKSIADRSDLLALNASLEGARAGEAGKGFALVANEMRRLAENTMESVGAIKGLVGDIQDSARTTAVACQEGLDRSEETTEVATKIKVVTQDQRENTGEVNRAMEDLSRLVTNSVAGIRQVTVTASELATLSESLREMVERFDVGDRHGVERWKVEAPEPAANLHATH